MKKFIGTRGSGKTVYTIQTAYKENGVIIVSTHEQKENVLMMCKDMETVSRISGCVRPYHNYFSKEDRIIVITSAKDLSKLDGIPLIEGKVPEVFIDETETVLQKIFPNLGGIVINLSKDQLSITMEERL